MIAKHLIDMINWHSLLPLKVGGRIAQVDRIYQFYLLGFVVSELRIIDWSFDLTYLSQFKSRNKAMQLNAVHVLHSPNTDIGILEYFNVYSISTHIMCLFEIIPWSSLISVLWCRRFDRVCGHLFQRQSSQDLKGPPTWPTCSQMSHTIDVQNPAPVGMVLHMIHGILGYSSELLRKSGLLGTLTLLSS